MPVIIKEQFDLTGKTALVAGGRGLLGRRFSAALTELGGRVFSADLPDRSLAAQKDPSHIPAEGIEQLDVDITDPTSVQRLADYVFTQARHIDILVYSVTAKPKDFYNPFIEVSLEGWQTILRAELDGLFLVAQQVGKIMEKQRSGSMILLSSIYGLVGNDQRIYEGANLSELYAGVSDERPRRIYAHPGYAAAKGAVISLTRYLAAYWGSINIRVNCISPGGLAHPGENQEFVQRYSQRVPLGRKAGLDEISGAMVYLASDASSYVTGHNLVVDGGWTAW